MNSYDEEGVDEMCDQCPSQNKPVVNGVPGQVEPCPFWAKGQPCPVEMGGMAEVV